MLCTQRSASSSVQTLACKVSDCPALLQAVKPEHTVCVLRNAAGRDQQHLMAEAPCVQRCTNLSHIRLAASEAVQAC